MIRRLGRGSLLFAALISCRPEVVVAPTEVEAVSVAVTSPTIISGNTTQATATAVDTRGRAVTEAARTWTTSSASIATVDANGVVTGVAAGTAIISASVLGVTGATTVTVQPRVIRAATVTVTSAVTSLVRGGTAQMVATMRDSAGLVLSGRTVTWTSSDPSVATVNSSGLVTGTGVGSVTITATSDGVFGTLPLTVTTDVSRVVLSLESFALAGVGKTQQLTAEPRNAGGAALSGRTVTWSSSDAAVATVTSTGLVTAAGVGTATIRATVDGVVGSAAVTVTSVPVASVQVSSAASSLMRGNTLALTVTLRDASGVAVTGRTVTWSSSNTAVATVDAAGVVTGAAVGVVTITATSEGVTGTRALTVTTDVSSVVLSPSSATIAVGGTQQWAAEPRNASGGALSGRTVTWSSSNTAVATVDVAGLVTAVAVGSATIRATVDGVVGSGSLTVTSVPVATVGVNPTTATLVVGGTQQLAAELRDANGAALLGRTVTWSSSDVAVATVSSNGLVTAVAYAGAATRTATITAASEGKTGTSVITVTPSPVATVGVSPATTSVVVGGTQQLTATPRNASGVALTGRTVTWVSSNAAVATVDAAGLVTAVAVGTVTLTATSEGKTGTAAITVTSVPVATVAVSPSTASMVVGGTQQLTAEARDASGAALTWRTVTWASSNTAVATVDATGLVTAVAYTGAATRTATITATSEGKTGASTITVTPSPVATVGVTPTTVTMVVGGAQSLTATPRDASGTALTGRTVTWSSSDVAVATVSSAGQVSAVAVGIATIRATVNGVVGSASVTVTSAPVATVGVSPVTASIVVGGTQQLTAEPRDASGALLTWRTVTWSSSNTSVATVSSVGLVTAVAVGTATITATSEGKTGTATITVTGAPVASVEILPGWSGIQIGDTLTLRTQLRDAAGNILTGRSVAWSSSNTNVATISQVGLFTATYLGDVSISASSEGVTGTRGYAVSMPGPCSEANPPSDKQSLCALTAYNLPPSVSWIPEYLYYRNSSGTTTFSITGGTGDADLEVINEFGTRCYPQLQGNNESCTFQSAGTFRIRVKAWQAFTDVTFRIIR